MIEHYSEQTLWNCSWNRCYYQQTYVVEVVNPGGEPAARVTKTIYVRLRRELRPAGA